MKILILHNSYQIQGGEDSVVSQELKLLKSKGHKVSIYVVSNDIIKGWISKLIAFLRAPYSNTSAYWIRDILIEEEPDIVHIHNFFPLLSPAIHVQISKQNIPVVQTLHNYRLICAGGTLLRNNQICEKCLHGSSLWGVVHRCYRMSFLGSLALVLMQRKAKSKSIWTRNVTRFIALTEFAKKKFLDYGINENQIVVKPNFTSNAIFKENQQRYGALYVGRLSIEKGVHTLIDAWKSISNIKLTIAGDGPEREWLEAQAPPNISFVGKITGKEVLRIMNRSQALIIPSIWYEGFPMSIVEAYSAGLPVIASDIGSLSECILQDETGMLFNSGDSHDLAITVKNAFSSPSHLRLLGNNARRLYLSKYTPDVNYKMLMEIYLASIAVAKV